MDYKVYLELREDLKTCRIALEEIRDAIKGLSDRRSADRAEGPAFHRLPEIKKGG